MQPGRSSKTFKGFQAELYIFKSCQAGVGKSDIFGDHVILHHTRLNMVGAELQHRFCRGKRCVDRDYAPSLRVRLFAD